MDTFIQKKIEEFREKFWRNRNSDLVMMLKDFESFLTLTLTEQKEMLRKKVKKIPTEDHNCIEDYKSDVLKILE